MDVPGNPALGKALDPKGLHKEVDRSFPQKLVYANYSVILNYNCNMFFNSYF